MRAERAVYLSRRADRANGVVAPKSGVRATLAPLLEHGYFGRRSRSTEFRRTRVRVLTVSKALPRRCPRIY